jgi:ABC-type nickel/cobalt efflux system permease component RcnA
LFFESNLESIVKILGLKMMTALDRDAYAAYNPFGLAGHGPPTQLDHHDSIKAFSHHHHHHAHHHHPQAPLSVMTPPTPSSTPNSTHGMSHHQTPGSGNSSSNSEYSSSSPIFFSS